MSHGLALRDEPFICDNVAQAKSVKPDLFAYVRTELCSAIFNGPWAYLCLFVYDSFSKETILDHCWGNIKSQSRTRGHTKRLMIVCLTIPLSHLTIWLTFHLIILTQDTVLILECQKQPFCACIRWIVRSFHTQKKIVIFVLWYN